MQIEGLYRHASTHAAGVVIGDRPLIELVPLYRDPRSDFLVTQYSMKHVEQAGLVKFDFLGLTTLTILQRAERSAARPRHRRSTSTVCRWTTRRPTRCWRRAMPAACSRWKARACATCCARCAPTGSRIWSPPSRCIVPARWPAFPNTAGASTTELRRRRIPSIHDILAETYGIIVYQEQVMQIAQKMAGYSLGGADLLRRAMGKKIPAEMEAQRDIFTKGAIERGIDPEKAKEVFDLMAKFRRLRLQQMPCGAVWTARLSDRMAEGEPSGGVHRCVHESLALGNTDRLAALREEAERVGHPHPAAGHQPLWRRLHGRADGRWQAGDPLCAGRGEEGRLRRDAGAGTRRAATGRSPTSPTSPPASIRGSSIACSLRT